MSQTTQYVAVAPGLDLAVDVIGDRDGTPVVLAHGGGQTRGSWGTAIEALAGCGFQCWSVDLRGHGDSDWAPDGSYHVSRVASDLAVVLQSVGRPAALVGASYGGVAALVAAGTLLSEGLTAVILVDVVPRMRAEGIDRIKAFMTSHPDGFADLQEAAAAVSGYLPQRASGSTRGLERNLRRRADGRWHWHWDPRLLDADASVPETVALVEAAARRVTVPVSLVRGLRSDVVDDAGVSALRALVPDLVVIDLPRAAHTAAADDNDAFADAVCTLLGSAPSGALLGPW